MNDLEMYREQLAMCDDKLIDALVERNGIIEKKKGWKKSYREINIRKKSMMYSRGFCGTAKEFRQESCFHIILY